LFQFTFDFIDSRFRQSELKREWW